MTMKEIQDFFASQYPPISPRQTIRIVQDLELDELIRKRRIKGKRKQKGYIINEDNIEAVSDMWFHFPKSKHIKKAFNQYWSQYNLSEFIDQVDRTYHDSLVIKPSDSKKLKKMKEGWKENFVWIQYHDMAHIVQWISQIEWALRTGILGSGKGKRKLAEDNISKLEAILELMSNDLKNHDKKIWKQVVISIYNVMEKDRHRIIDSKFSIAKTKS